MSTNGSTQPFVVAIGASAGGLEALQEFLGHLPPALNHTSIIIAQHLSPTHKSMLVQLLSRGTQLEVAEAVHGMELVKGKVYITPPDKEITLINGRIHLQKPSFAAGPKPSVDILFESLAAELKKRAIGIILSGTGSDGALGVTSIKKAGGFIIAQEPQTCKYDGMPMAAIETGNVDLILSPNKMGESLMYYLENPQKLHMRISSTDENATTLEKIFKLLSKRTGTDFSHYKPSTICRRLEKRLSMLQMHSIEEYLPLVEKNPKELDIMFNMILIGVTSFFRDFPSFNVLEKYLRNIIEKKADKAPIRIWVPGCSTGEEAYSLAILLSVILKEKAFMHNIQIFATDIDEKAIAFARRGLYQESSLENVPKEIIDTYFIKKGRDYELVKTIRMMVLFSKHDVTKNPPFLKLDLITCRNLLIYFGANLQKQVIPIFHYALNANGYLFLGKSETIGQFSDLFATIDEKAKIYQRKAVGNIHGIKFSAFRTQRPDTTIRQNTTVVKVASRKENSLVEHVKDTLFQHFVHPHVVINDAFDIQEIYGDVRLYLTFSSGVINVNLLRMVNSELHIELRSVITKCIKDQVFIKSSIKKFELFAHVYYVRFSCMPLNVKDGSDNLYVVVFEQLDLADFLPKNELKLLDADPNDEKLQELEQELAATKEHLQTYIEELETSNEELQSLNEEMQSTNEELQSSNEELETSNEELQSTNEEIQIAYTELKSANEQLERIERELRENDANLNAMLNNDLQAFILVDQQYGIIAFNGKAKELFVDISNKRLKIKNSIIDYIGIAQVEAFITDFKQSLQGETVSRELTIALPKKFARSYIFNFSPVVNPGDKFTIVSIGILETTSLREALSNLSASQELLASVFEATSIGICVTDSKGNFVNINHQYCTIYGYEKSELLGQNFTLVVPEENRQWAQQLHDNFIATGVEVPAEWQVQKKNGSIIDIFVTAELLVQPDGSRFKVTSIRDITENKKYKNLLLQTQETAKIAGWEMDVLSNEIYFSEEVGKIFDLPIDTIANEAEMMGMLEAKDAEELHFLLDEAKINGTPFVLTTDVVTKSGATKCVHISCKPILSTKKVVKLFGTFQDITQQKKIEDNFRKLSRAVEQSASSILITDLTGKIEYANPAFCNITGYTLSEVLGKNPNILKSGYTSDDEYKQMWHRLSEGKSWLGTFCNKKKNGELFWESANITPVFDKAGIVTNFVAVKENITQQKVAEKERDIIYKIISVFNEADTLQTALEQLLKIVCQYLQFKYAEAWLVNFDSSQLVYQVHYASGRTANGYVPANITIAKQQNNTLVGKAWNCKNMIIANEAESNLVVPYSKLAGKIKTSIAIPILNQMEIVAVCTFFSELPIHNGEGQLGLLQKLMLEIGGYIEKKKKEEELDRFFTLAPNMLCIQGNDGYFKKVNPAFEKVLGYTQQELLAVPVVALMHADDVAHTVQIFADRHLQEVQSYENRFIAKSGEIKWLAWKSVAIDKEIVYQVANDVTTEFALNAERKELIAELIRNNMELKQFSYITSHNMRSPITNMLSIFQLLNKSAVQDAETIDLLTALEQTTVHLNDTLNDLVRILIIKESNDIDVKPISFQVVCDKALRDINNLVSVAEIHTQFADCPTVVFNEGYLESIFLNLLTNAIKYAHPDRQPVIKIESYTYNNCCVLRVADNGLGMNMERIKDKIFGLHQRFHSKSNSSGMGLYIVKSQVEALGGSIEVQSQENIGSVFTITFKPNLEG